MEIMYSFRFGIYIIIQVCIENVWKWFNVPLKNRLRDGQFNDVLVLKCKMREIVVAYACRVVIALNISYLNINN